MTVRRFAGESLVLATHNRGKLAEMQALFAERAITLSTAADLGLPAPPETGTTFLENAAAKALFVARAAQTPALADDSGLCVDALDGAPGVYSADWAETVKDGPRDFGMAMEKLRAALEGKPDKSAAFVCCLVLAWPDGHVESAEGRAAGEIVWPPRGKEGHGYDPVFRPAGYDVTYAQVPAAEKNAISHRAKAFRMMMDKCF